MGATSPTSTPSITTPWLCDGKTVRDVLPCDVQHPNGKRSEQYRLNAASADDHRWFYFPYMAKDELLIFKQYDSDPKARVRYCFHTAFSDPNISADAPARQSIEVRALALFNDAMVDPPPLVRNLSDEVFEARVLSNRAPAAPKVQNARGKRKMPVRAQPHSPSSHSQDLQFDQDLQLAIKMSAARNVQSAQHGKRKMPVRAQP